MTAVEYRREMNRNYLVLKPEPGGKGRYAEKMLRENKISGLLSFHVKKLDGQCRYYFDITSRQPLGRMLEQRTMNGKEIRQLISALLHTLKQMERYLLDEGQLNLNPDFIYIEPESFRCYLCLIPGYNKNFSDEFCELAKYLLDHVNHMDTEAVVLAFGIFQESRKLNFGMESLEQIVNQRGTGQEKTDLRNLDVNADEDVENRRPENGRVVYEGPANESSGGKYLNLRPHKSRNSKSSVKETINHNGGNRETPLNKIPGSKEFTGRKKHVHSWRIVFFPMFLVPILITIFLGTMGLWRYKWIVIGLELLLILVLLILKNVEGGDQDKRKEYQDNEIYRGPEWGTDTEQQTHWSRRHRGSQMPGLAEVIPGTSLSVSEEIPGGWESLLGEMDEREESRSKNPEDIELKTVLLTGAPESANCHRLVPVQGGEEIPLRYFPFLIGKNRDLADYCLDHPGVSRLHIRIDEMDEGYLVTDLNSTNGTKVGEKILAANDCCRLTEGEKVEIAGITYQFF